MPRASGAPSDGVGHPPVIGSRATVQLAVNQVLAAAIAWRDVQVGDNLSAAVAADADARLIDAVGQYEATRSETDAARDAFLARYPTPDDVQAALNGLRSTALRYGLFAEAEASVRLDGETITIDGPGSVGQR